MSKNNSKSSNLKAGKSIKKERRDHGLPTTPQNIKPPPVKEPKKPQDNK